MQIKISFLEQEQRLADAVVNMIRFFVPDISIKQPDNHPPVRFVYLTTKNYRKLKKEAKSL